MNRIVVFTADEELDVFQNDDLEVLYECVAQYPETIYFHAHVELIVTEETSPFEYLPSVESSDET